MNEEINLMYKIGLLTKEFKSKEEIAKKCNMTKDELDDILKRFEGIGVKYNIN